MRIIFDRPTYLYGKTVWEQQNFCYVVMRAGTNTGYPKPHLRYVYSTSSDLAAGPQKPDIGDRVGREG